MSWWNSNVHTWELQELGSLAKHGYSEFTRVYVEQPDTALGVAAGETKVNPSIASRYYIRRDSELWFELRESPVS